MVDTNAKTDNTQRFCHRESNYVFVSQKHAAEQFRNSVYRKMNPVGWFFARVCVHFVFICTVCVSTVGFCERNAASHKDTPIKTNDKHQKIALWDCVRCVCGHDVRKRSGGHQDENDQRYNGSLYVSAMWCDCGRDESARHTDTRATSGRTEMDENRRLGFTRVASNRARSNKAASQRGLYAFGVVPTIEFNIVHREYKRHVRMARCTPRVCWLL